MYGNIGEALAEYGIIGEALAEYGKVFEEIDPHYTSQRCNSCGYIDRQNRKTQKNFECINCGYKDNADINAAKNILNYKFWQNDQQKLLVEKAFTTLVV